MKNAGSVPFRFTLAVLLMISFSTLSYAQQEPPKPMSREERFRLKNRAEQTIAELQKNLGSALKAAMKQGGPEKAISVCQTKALPLTHELQRGGIQVGRTSHKLRNPKNAPEDWLKPFVKEFKGKKMEDVVAFQDKILPDGSYLYVKPIGTKPLCLTCHGKSLAPNVKKRLQALYPKDEATGFSSGDVRGLFWVKMTP